MIDKIKNIITNNKNLVANIFATGGINVISIIIALFATPAYMRYFDDDAILGLWFTLLSILEAMSVMDFGLGNGIRNRLTEAIARKESTKGKKIVSSGYCIIIVIIIVIFILGNIILTFIPWKNALNINSNNISPKEILLCIRLIYFSIMLQIVLKLINSILYALQKAAIATFLPVCTNMLMLIFVLIGGNGNSVDKLIYLFIWYCVVSNLPYFIVTCWLFWGRYKEYRPSIRYADKEMAVSTFKLGLVFFYLTLMSMMTHNTNELIISALFKSSYVVDYQIYNKVYILIPTAMNVIMIPLWSAATKELAKKNYFWLKGLYNFLYLVSVGAFFMACMIIPFMQPIINVWLGENAININPVLCIPFILYVTINAFNGANATVANGCGWLKVQMIMAPVSAILNIPFSILLKYVLGDWTAIVLANVLSLLPITVAQYIYIRKKLNKLCEVQKYEKEK